MKKYIFLILIFQLVIIKSHCQQPASSIYGQYIWTQSTLLTPCDIDGNPIPTQSQRLAIPKQRFKVLKLVDADKNLVIQILNYPDTSTNYLKYNYFGKKEDFIAHSETNKLGLLGTQQAYFKVSMNDITQFAVKDFVQTWALAIGVINFPFKLRPQKGLGDFSGSFNFGAALGVTIPHRSWRRLSQTFITGYSISSINMDSASVTQNAGKLDSTNNYAAFSFSLGWLFEFDKIQIGVFLGWDKISRINQLLYGWKYQGRPWLSIGFGYSIFSATKPSEPNDIKQ